MERGQKADPLLPTTIFYSITSTNVEISQQNFPTFSFTPFDTLVSNFKAIASAGPKLLNLNQDTLQKKLVFWSNSYNNEVMITSVTEMLGLLNFGHMTTSAV